MPINLRPIAYGTGLTLSTDGKLRIEPISTRYDDEITIQARLGHDGVRWLINPGTGGSCLNRDGNWEWEPPAALRDEAFFARCRYASLEEAAGWLRQCAESGGAL